MYALKRESGSTPKLAKILAVRKANWLELFTGLKLFSFHINTSQKESFHFRTNVIAFSAPDMHIYEIRKLCKALYFAFYSFLNG